MRTAAALLGTLSFYIYKEESNVGCETPVLDSELILTIAWHDLPRVIPDSRVTLFI